MSRAQYSQIKPQCIKLQIALKLIHVILLYLMRLLNVGIGDRSKNRVSTVSIQVISKRIQVIDRLIDLFKNTFSLILCCCQGCFCFCLGAGCTMLHVGSKLGKVVICAHIIIFNLGPQNSPYRSPNVLGMLFRSRLNNVNLYLCILGMLSGQGKTTLTVYLCIIRNAFR